METEENVSVPPPVPQPGSVRRRNLFMTQSCLSLFLVAAAVIMYGLELTSENWFKVGIAPFGAFSLLFFLMFLFATLIERFQGEDPYPRRIAAIAGAFILALSPLVFWISRLMVSAVASVEQLVFWYAILASVVAFIFFRTRSLWSMAVLTAIAEGLVLQLVFT